MRRTACTSTRAAGAAAALAAAALLLGCAGSGAVRTAPLPLRGPGPAIRSLLLRSAQAWNRGDLDGFMRPYLDSDSTTFVGSTGIVHGVTAVREHYRATYFQHGAPPFLLSFRNIHVRPLGRDYALAVGWYILRDRRGGTVRDRGIFSLTLLHTRNGWRIIHDHSSSLSRR